MIRVHKHLVKHSVTQYNLADVLVRPTQIYKKNIITMHFSYFHSFYKIFFLFIEVSNKCFI